MTAQKPPLIWHDRARQEIVELLKNLPANGAITLPEGVNNRDEFIYLWSELLVNAAGYGPDKGHPHTLPATKKMMNEEIDTIKKHASLLLDALDNMHAPTVAALGYPPPGNNNNLQMALRLFFAQIETTETASAIPDLSVDKVGRPPNARAATATEITAQIYTILTGKAATRLTDTVNGKISPFENLLEKVCIVLKIDSSAEHSVRKSSKSRKSHTSE